MSGSAQTLAFLRDAEESFELDQEGALRHAAAAEEAGRATGDVELELRGQALLADVWLRRTDSTGDATQLLRTVEFRAAEHGLPLLQARAHRLLSRVAANMGDFAGQLDHALRGLELLPPQAAPRLRIMHLMALSEALFRTRSAEAAVRRYAEAEEVALAAGDTLFRSYILNDLAYCLYASGQPARAETVSARLLAALAHEGRRPIPPMLDTLARIQLALGRTAEAVRTAQQLVAHAPEHDEYPEGAAEAALTLAAAHHQAGSLADAQAALNRADELTAAPELARVRVNVLREQAELHATRGDFQAAFTTYKAFHEANEEISSREREAQARIRQTAFETAEARRDAERFREESLRDPLTGLHNRRYVDAQLPRLLAGGQLPLVAAIVDIDHFKMINDSCSHEIGDQVLVVIAGLLGAAIPSGPVAVPAGLAATPADLSGGPAGHGDLALGAMDGAAGTTGFAARLGGEEFLIVLVGPGSDALARLERLREAIAGHPWHFLTGDLPVTVSIGVAAGEYPQRPADLLGAADRNLYTAKRGGRNRLCAQ